VRSSGEGKKQGPCEARRNDTTRHDTGGGERTVNDSLGELPNDVRVLPERLVAARPLRLRVKVQHGAKDPLDARRLGVLVGWLVGWLVGGRDGMTGG
jgi:hypothetical protein